MGTRRTVISVVVALVFAALPVAAPPAGAVTTAYDVRIAAELNGLGQHQVSMRFFPSTIEILQGDTLHFTSAGTHSATLLPLGQEPATWFSLYSSGLDLPWSTLLSDPDEGAAARKLNPAVLFRSDPGCGSVSTPCTFDGSGDGEDGVLHSGLNLGASTDFSVTVDVPANNSFWVVDLVNPNMKMQVTVVSADPDSQAAIDADRAQTIADDAVAAADLHAKYANKRVKTVNKKTGKVTWSAWAGVDTANVALRYLYPLKLSIKRNQFVKWRFDQLRHQGYSVTFPADFASDVSGGLPQVQCDNDTDAGNDPDSEREQPEPFLCNDLSHVEFDMPPQALGKVGNGAFAGGADLASSGIRGGVLSTSARPYTLKFTKASSKRGFTYSTITSPEVTAKVVVSE